MTALVIPARFNGPAESGHGGISAGRLAAFLPGDAAVQVTLRRPVPLDTPLRVEVSGEAATAYQAGDVVAEGAVVDRAVPGTPVAAVSFAEAQRAAADFAGLAAHPFPTCFVCGSRRPAGDGLQVFAGPVDADPHRTAAPFVVRADHLLDDPRAARTAGHPVDGALRALVWAVLDCPGGWAIGLPQRPAVLGRMAARVVDVPATGERCVVVGKLDRWDGRKAYTRTTAYGADGRELGRAAAVWIEIPPPQSGVTRPR